MSTKNHHNHESGLLVHEFLAHSYLIYLASIVLGLIADFIWPLKFSFENQGEYGFLCILLGTAIIVWAQRSGRRSGKIRASAEKIEHHHFKTGPYMFTRIPTQYGLSLLVIGLALIYGFTFMLLSSVLAFLVSKLFFVPIHERHLTNKYGDAYREYTRHVKH